MDAIFHNFNYTSIKSHADCPIRRASVGPPNGFEPCLGFPRPPPSFLPQDHLLKKIVFDVERSDVAIFLSLFFLIWEFNCSWWLTLNQFEG